MALNIVNSAHSYDNLFGNGYVSVTFTTTSSNMLLAFVGDTNTNNTDLVISDTQSNSWTKILDINSGNADGLQIWIAYGIKAGSTTIKFTHNGSHAAAMSLYEISGTASSNAIDLNFGQELLLDGSGTAASSGVGPATIEANEILFGAAMTVTNSTTVWTADSGYTPISSPNALFTEYKMVSAIQASPEIGPLFTYSGSAYVRAQMVSVSDTPIVRPTTNPGAFFAFF